MDIQQEQPSLQAFKEFSRTVEEFMETVAEADDRAVRYRGLELQAIDVRQVDGPEGRLKITVPAGMPPTEVGKVLQSLERLISRLGTQAGAAAKSAEDCLTRLEVESPATRDRISGLRRIEVAVRRVLTPDAGPTMFPPQVVELKQAIASQFRPSSGPVGIEIGLKVTFVL